MLRGIYTSATGMKAQELMIDNTANNLANVNTTGFKRSNVDFADLLYTTVQQAGTPAAAGQTTPTGLQIGSGVRAAGTTKIFSNGSMNQTDNKLDVAIEGDGFLQVLLPSGEQRFTRAGSLKLNETGQLVTTDGFQLAEGITIPDGTALNQLSIGVDGTVSGVTSQTQNAPTSFGNIQLYRFPNPAGLSSQGNNLFAATGASGAEVAGTPGQNGLGTLRQGFLEGSNVQVVTELISLITAQRAYEINSRAIRAGDEMLSTAVEIIR